MIKNFTIIFLVLSMFFSAAPRQVQAQAGQNIQFIVERQVAGGGGSVIVTVNAFTTDPTDRVISVDCTNGSDFTPESCQAELTNNVMFLYTARTAKGFMLSGADVICEVDKVAPQSPTDLVAANITGLSTSNVWTNQTSPKFTWPAVTDGNTICSNGAPVSGSGVMGYEVYFGTDANGGVTVGSSTFRVLSPVYNPAALSTSGIYYLRIRPYDRANNTGAWKTIYYYRYDGLAPVVLPSLANTPDGLNGWFVNQSPALSVQIQDAHSSVVSTQGRVNGGPWMPIGSVSISGEGVTTLDFQAVDAAGNVGSATQTVKIDRTPISYTLVKPRRSSNPGVVLPDWFNNDVTLYDKTTIVRVANDLSGVGSVQYKGADGSWGDVAPTFSSTGTYSVDVRTTDGAGNQSSGKVTINLDKEPPTISATLDTTNLLKAKTVRLKITAGDVPSGLFSVAYRIGYTVTMPINTVNQQGDFIQDVDFSLLPAGIYSLTAIVTDLAGNINTQAFAVSTVFHSTYLPAVVR